MWPDSTVYILGGGPSLNLVDVGRLRGQRVIACNHAYQKAPWIDVMLFADYRFYFDEKERLAKFSGLKITTNERHHDKPGLLVVRRRNSLDKRAGGIFRQPNLVCWNKSTGALVFNFAYHFGAKKIVLFGYDMRRMTGVEIMQRARSDVKLRPEHLAELSKVYEGVTQEFCNWHETVPTAGKKNPYARFLERFPKIASDLKELEIDCVNATPGSAIKCFPIVTPEEVYPE